MKYANFGSGDAALLTSVPRPALRQNMVSIAEEAGVVIHFRTKASDIEPDGGRLTAETAGQSPRTLTADLIVVADGVHSLADKMVEAFPGGQLRMRTEPLNYVTVLLDEKACAGLSLHHIHFWHQPRSGAVSIGLPNKDGSIAVLLISDYKGVEHGASPFATPDQAQRRLTEDFPRILALDPKLADRLLDRKPGRFYYKSITHYALGRRCVVVGDAGSATPPWAGFGANTAVYSADALIRFMVGMPGDTYQALKGFERHKLALAELILEYADQHGEFLRTKVAETPEDRPIAQALGYLVNEAVEKSNVPDGVKLLRF
jgi:2-polyprenyl-6-methoxyphenol hydroxylase-like FAD-dependent oxidoreductase